MYKAFWWKPLNELTNFRHELNLAWSKLFSWFWSNQNTACWFTSVLRGQWLKKKRLSLINRMMLLQECESHIVERVTMIKGTRLNDILPAKLSLYLGSALTLDNSIIIPRTQLGSFIYFLIFLNNKYVLRNSVKRSDHLCFPLQVSYLRVLRKNIK